MNIEILAAMGNKKAVKTLLANNANINQKTNNCDNALVNAARNGHLPIVKLLLANNANINHANRFGYTALLVAAENGDLEVVKHLIKSGADINVKNNNGYTALLLTARNGHLEVVKHLIEKGANINHANEVGYTALFLIVRNDNLEIFEFLLIRYDNLEDVDWFYNIACNFRAEKIKALLEEIKTLKPKILLDTKKIADDINQILMNETNNSSLKEMESKIISILNNYYHSISKNKNVSSNVHQLLKKELINNLKFGEENYSLLHIAVLNNWSNLVSYLINNWPIDINYQDSSGNTAWNHACLLLQPKNALLIKTKEQLTLENKEFLKILLPSSQNWDLSKKQITDERLELIIQYYNNKTELKAIYNVKIINYITSKEQIITDLQSNITDKIIKINQSNTIINNLENWSNSIWRRLINILTIGFFCNKKSIINQIKKEKEKLNKINQAKTELEEKTIILNNKLLTYKEIIQLNNKELEQNKEQINKFDNKKNMIINRTTNNTIN